jgi:SpoVK/Ycf46/Vps4 family AAA+-type ATPase
MSGVSVAHWAALISAGVVIFVAAEPLSDFIDRRAGWLVDSLESLLSGLTQAPTSPIAKAIKDKFGRDVELTEEEARIALEIVDLARGEASSEGLSCVGGNESAKRQLRDLLVVPKNNPRLFLQGSKLLSLPKGILLYGPPGTGKTLMARAAARESNIPFINVKVSGLFSKWFGESERRVAELFSLARKLAPCILFLDEIDGLLAARDGSEHRRTVLTEFMGSWDGIESEGSEITVIGTTNRADTLDEAVQRRLPRQIHVGLPGRAERVDILRVLLRTDKVVDAQGVDLDVVAQRTEAYSGSDLAELCKAAAGAAVIRELAKEEEEGEGEVGAKKVVLTTDDILQALDTVKSTTKTSEDHHRRKNY